MTPTRKQYPPASKDSDKLLRSNLPSFKLLMNMAESQEWNWAKAVYYDTTSTAIKALTVIVTGPLAGMMRHHDWITSDYYTWFERDASSMSGPDFETLASLDPDIDLRLIHEVLKKTRGGLLKFNGESYQTQVYEAGEEVTL